jgi:exonuclease VII small subunit
MEQIYGTGEASFKQAVISDVEEKQRSMSRTIGYNIEIRIAHYRAEIARLERVKKQLESGSSLLDIRIEDLHQAMNY